MLTPWQLDILPNEIAALFEALEDSIIGDIARAVQKTGAITETSLYKLEQAQNMGYDLNSIRKGIAKTLEFSDKAVDALMNDAIKESYARDKSIFSAANMNPVKTPMSETYLQDYLKAVVQQTNNELHNITGSLGFKTPGGFQPIATAYQSAMDLAHLQVSSGVLDYNQAVRQAVKSLADSGLSYVDYETGRVNHLDVAVKRAVRTGITQTAGEMARLLADEFGSTLMEITAHAGARPDHAVWQGKIVDMSGKNLKYLKLSQIGYGEVTGFLGGGCRHNWFPYVEGFSTRAYTDEQLQNIDPPPFEYNGKTYDAYHATQKQRQMETAMRQTKRELAGYDAVGDTEAFTVSSAKLRAQRNEYLQFSNAAGLRAQNDAHQVLEYGRSLSSKSVWANRKLEDAIVNTGKATGLSSHAIDRMGGRGVKTSSILDALNNPLDVGPLKYNKDGKPSNAYIGEKATVAVNPINGIISTVHPTKSRIAKKLKGKIEND